MKLPKIKTGKSYCSFDPSADYVTDGRIMVRPRFCQISDKELSGLILGRIGFVMRHGEIETQNGEPLTYPDFVHITKGAEILKEKDNIEAIHPLQGIYVDGLKCWGVAYKNTEGKKTYIQEQYHRVISAMPFASLRQENTDCPIYALGENGDVMLVVMPVHIA